MARYRTIKPELFADEALVEVPIEVRFLFIGLLPFVDDKGRRQYSPRRIKLEVFPGDDDVSFQQVDAWMKALDKANVIRIYEHDDTKYFWFPRFLRHQRIDRPSHSYCPPHPDDPEPLCMCNAVECRELREQAHKHKRNGRNVPKFTRRVLDDSTTTHRVLDEDSLPEVREVREVGNGNEGKARESVNGEVETVDPQEPGYTSERDRNAPLRAAAEIAERTLDMLGIPRNMMIIEVLTRTLLTRGEVEMCSVELAANNIAGKAAMVAREALPVSWEQWLADAAYDYVPQGDKRINARGQMARPVCGGKLCSEGWEPVLIGGERRLRRCPDCVQAWRDAGLE